MQEDKSASEGILQRVWKFPIRRPWSTLGLAFILTAVSIISAQNITLRANFSDLLPDGHPSVIDARRLNEVVGGASFIVLAVETQSAKAAEHFLADLRQGVAQWPELKYIDDHPPSDFFRKHGLLYLSLDDLDIFYQRIKSRIEDGKLSRAGLSLDLDDEDPFDVSNFEEKYALYLRENAHYQNREGTLFVSLLKPNWRRGDTSQTKPFLEKLERLVNELNPASYHPSVMVRFTGPYVKAVRQQTLVQDDAILVSLVAFFGAILYLFIHFRRKRAIFFIGFPLLVSVSWSLGVAYLLFGSLNLFSSIACAVVLGLAADYGIHLLSEYGRHRSDGFVVKQALEHALGRLRRPFFIAATTTAAAFFSLGLSDFKAFHEFGMIAGIGVISCALAFLFIFPAWTVIVESWRPQDIELLKRHFQRQALWAHKSKAIFSRCGFFIFSIVLFAPLLSLAAGRLYFDFNLNNIMGTQVTKSLDQRVDAIFDRTVNPEVALVESADDAAYLAKAMRRVKKQNEASKRGTTISEIVSYHDFVPGEQALKMKKIAQVRALFTPTIIRSMTLENRASYEEFKVLLSPSPVSEEMLPEKIKIKFRDREGGLGRIVFIFPNFQPSQGHLFLRFVEEVRQVECRECQGPFYASGESSVFADIIKLIFSEGKYVMILALLTIFGLLCLNFLSFKVACVAFMPLLLGLLALLGWMSLLGIPFNIINLAAIPVVLGIVTDYVVHFYQRYRSSPDLSMNQVFSLSFRPIIGSALTTMIGFGALLLADSGGIRSFGLTCCMGIFLSTVVILFWFPALFSLRDVRTGEKI